MEINKLGPRGPYQVAIPYADGETYTYEIEKLGAEAATDLLLDCVSVVGESMGALTSLLMGNKNALDLDLGSNAVEALFRKLTGGLTRDRNLTKRLLKQLSSDKMLCNGAKIQFDSFYADKLALSLLAVRANLQVQFGNFFAAAASLLPSPGSQAAQNTPAQG